MLRLTFPGLRTVTATVTAGLVGCVVGATSASAQTLGGTTWQATAAPCTAPGTIGSCEVSGRPRRPYRVYVPSRADLTLPQPIVLLFHGGGGSANSALEITCPPSAAGRPDMASPSCLHQVAEREGFVVVVPNGVSSPVDPASRTFNAGGGRDGWQCVSGYACTTAADDESYVRDVLDQLNGWLNVDTRATFATGLSNGAAFAHRLACTMSSRIAAIASVGGVNQYATSASCQPEQSVAILQIHGSVDPCWTYEESDRSCTSGLFGRKVGVDASAAGWASRLGCEDTPSVVREPDLDEDGLQTVSSTWSGCRAPVVSQRVEGAGHTWPNGFQYAADSFIGPISREWGSERIWAFFSANRRQVPDGR